MFAVLCVNGFFVGENDFMRSSNSLSIYRNCVTTLLFHIILFSYRDVKMNPADFGMFWINQYAQAERMVMDDNTSYYAQPSIGMSVLDDISHQTNSLVSYDHGDGSTNRRKFKRTLFLFDF